MNLQNNCDCLDDPGWILLIWLVSTIMNSKLEKFRWLETLKRILQESSPRSLDCCNDCGAIPIFLLVFRLPRTMDFLKLKVPTWNKKRNSHASDTSELNSIPDKKFSSSISDFWSFKKVLEKQLAINGQASQSIEEFWTCTNQNYKVQWIGGSVSKKRPHKSSIVKPKSQLEFVTWTSDRKLIILC